MVTASPSDESAAVKPRLRGVIHQYSAMVAVAAGIALVIGAALLRGTGAALATTIYAITIVALFTVSATYHRVTWKTVRARTMMKRADHSMIFLFIAGSYTPFCVLGLDSPTRWWVLAVVWGGALAGVILKVSWPAAPRWLGVSLYILLGWVVIAAAPQLISHCGWLVIILLFIGGVLYSVGGILYATRWPDPWPTVFGHHEFFHACTAVAAIAHYIAVWLVITA